MSEKLVLIKKKKSPTIIFLAICILGTFFSGMVNLEPPQEITMAGKYLAGAVTFVFFVGVLWGFSELLYSNAGVYFGKDGFYDRTTRMSCGFVPWSNVKRITINGNKSQCYAILKLHNPRDVIVRTRGPVSRVTNSIQYYVSGSPIVINLNGYELKLKDMVAHFYAAYGQDENIAFNE